ILEDKKGKQYILQGKPDQAFQVPSTPEETVSMNYGKDALQGGQKEKFDFYDVYTYMFKEVSDNPGESGQLSEAQTALKNEIEKVKGWFASAKFMQVEFDKNKGGPLQEALTKAENGLKSGELSNNELKAEKEALIQAEKDFEAEMRAGIDDTLEVLDEASQVDNKFIKEDLDSLTEELSNLKQSESFSPANIQLAFYKSEKLFHRLDILEELPEAQELHKTRPGNKRLKDAIEAAKNSIEDSRMNNAKLKAIYKELVDAMAEAQAQKPGKLVNGEYPSIKSVVILTDQDTLVQLPAEIEDRTVTKAVLKKGEEVIAEEKYALDFANRTLTLKDLTASDVGKYTLILQSDEYEDLELPFELRTGKTIQYTFKGLAHVKRERTWRSATSYYLVATVDFNDKHEVEKFELNPAVAKEGIDSGNEKGTAGIKDVRELTYEMEEDEMHSPEPIKCYEKALFAENQPYWDDMIYGYLDEESRVESFGEIVKRKGVRSKADFEGLQTLYQKGKRNDKNIDAVSGATISSNAAKEAILDAFSQFEAQFK
ncbi:MAG: FMN-binding protein, partial [Peptococcus niger]